MSLVAYGDSGSDDSGSDEETSKSEVASVSSSPTVVEVQRPVESDQKETAISDSDEDTEAEIIQKPVTPKHLSLSSVLPPPKIVSVSSENHTDLSDVPISSLLSKLPAPKSSSSGSIDPLRLCGKTQKKQPVKILIPSLNQFQDEEEEENEPVRKKIKPSQTGCGLIGMLPAPRNLSLKETSRQLIPDVLTRKAEKKTEKVKPLPRKEPKVTPRSASVNSAPIKQTNEVWSDDEEETTDFFSLNSTKEPIPDIKLPVVEEKVAESTRNSFLSSDTCKANVLQNGNPSMYIAGGSKSYTHGNVQASDISNYDYSTQEHTTLSAAASGFTSTQKEDFTQEEGFKRLLGKRLLGKEEVNIIDISADTQRAEAHEILLKSMTEESVYQPARKKGGMPTQQQRRKHQITYLAHQAKEKEQELKNQWSQNRLTKRQTQSKYGF